MRPGPFGHQLVRPNNASRRDLARTEPLLIAFARATIYHQSFIIVGCKIWNSLLFEITTSESLDEFRCQCYL